MYILKKFYLHLVIKKEAVYFTSSLTLIHYNYRQTKIHLLLTLAPVSERFSQIKNIIYKKFKAVSTPARDVFMPFLMDIFVSFLERYVCAF